MNSPTPQAPPPHASEVLLLQQGMTSTLPLSPQPYPSQRAVPPLPPEYMNGGSNKGAICCSLSPEFLRMWVFPTKLFIHSLSTQEGSLWLFIRLTLCKTQIIETTSMISPSNCSMKRKKTKIKSQEDTLWCRGYHSFWIHYSVIKASFLAWTCLAKSAKCRALLLHCELGRAALHFSFSSSPFLSATSRTWPHHHKSPWRVSDQAQVNAADGKGQDEGHGDQGDRLGPLS